MPRNAITGNRKKSMVTTTVTSVNCIAFVMQKWAVSAVNPIIASQNHSHSCGVCQLYTENSNAMGSCIVHIINNMVSGFSVTVRYLVVEWAAP